MGEPLGVHGQRQAGPLLAPLQSFSHEAMLHAGMDEFTRGASSFVRDGLAGGESVLVIVDPEKVGRLRAELGRDAEAVRFADMNEIGSNPARIIPAWRDFVNESAGAGRSFRGIGESMSSGRSVQTLVEWQRHESLLNLAFDGLPGWRLMCPYDTETLSSDVIDEALRSHPVVRRDDTEVRSDRFNATAAAPFDVPLPEPTVTPEILAFDLPSLRTMRTYVGNRAAAMGLTRARGSDLVLALNEVATNSVRHGGGSGVLRLWRDEDSVICEIRDRGHIDRPLLGRERPIPGQDGGLGLWLANQLCDLVQIRSFADGSVVRIHMSVA